MFVLFAGALVAVPANADTLQEALEAAYQNNPSVEAGRANTRAAQEVVTQAKAAYGPTVTLDARHEYTYTNTNFALTTSVRDGFGTTASLRLTQPLFTSGRLASGWDIATANRLAVEEDLRSTTQQLLLDVISAYVRLRRDTKLYDVSFENYNLLLGQRDLTASRYRLRDATLPDVEQTDNRLQLAAGRLIRARSTMETSAARYRNLVGKYPGTLEEPPALPDLPDLEAIYEVAEVQSPDIARARFDEVRSRSELAQARAEKGPMVSANVAGQRAPINQYQNTLRTNSITAGVSLSMPLYTGGYLSSRVRESVQRNQSDQQLVEQARRDVREAIGGNFALYRAAQESLPRYNAAVESGENAVEGVRRQEQAGIRRLRDVLDVTNDLLNAQISLAETEAEAYLRHAAVLKSAGVLSIDMFSQVEQYDPASYLPWMAGLAGLPLKPVLNPLDSLLVNGRRADVPVQSERDDQYEVIDTLENPLVPLDK